MLVHNQGTPLVLLEECQIKSELLQLKRSLSEDISNSRINQAYERALRSGALGGKLLGAGAAGFLLFYCEREKDHALRTALADPHELEFQFDLSGSRIIYSNGNDIRQRGGFFG